MWDSEPRAGKSSEKWYFAKKVVRCPKFPIGRTFRGDYEYWKPGAYHFKAGAVNITIILYELGFVICMFYLRPSWEREQLHIWWQLQVARKASRMQSNATAKRFLCTELAIYWYLTWKRTLQLYFLRKLEKSVANSCERAIGREKEAEWIRFHVGSLYWE